MSGPLHGVRVVEWCGEAGAFAGKLLADLGADVVKVEPPGGDATRSYPPFLDDEPHPERSLFFWHYNTSKRGVTLDLERAEGRELFGRLVAACDVLLEDQPPGRMAALGLDEPDLRPAQPGLLYVSITPFGRSGPRSEELATDLTILAGGGPAWSCGYDDHALPPVRGGGNQGYQTACHWAVLATLTALLYRDQTGQGQHIDVNMHAASNVTTEAGSYSWLVAGETVQRQTGRHASAVPSAPSQVQARDGRWVNSGFPPRRPREFAVVLEWLRELGLEAQFEPAPLLEAAAARDRDIDFRSVSENEAEAALFAAGRDAMNFLAEHLDAYEFFHGAQQRGFQCGIIYAPEEVITDPHFVARGFPVQVEHPELGRSFSYPGAPYQFRGSPWAIQRRAPLIGEHNAEVFGALSLSAEQLAALTG